MKMCMSCLGRGIHAPDCDDITTTWSRTYVSQWLEMPAEPRTGVRRVSGWSLASLVAGSVLVALGWILNEPVSRVVWEALQHA